MRPRVIAAKLAISLGIFKNSLPLLLMKPSDLIEFGKISYSKKKSLDSFSDNNLLSDGLSKEEFKMLKATTLTSGKILILGVGGGREAIELGKSGFEISGTDFVHQMCETAKKNCEKAGIKLEVHTQEFSKLSFPENSFDIVWLSTGMYSAIPTKENRIKFLTKIKKVLKNNRYAIMQFYWDNDKKYSPVRERFKKIFSFIFLANSNYETGDVLRRNTEFFHFFYDKKSIESELQGSGMEIRLLEFPENGVRGNIVLQKNQEE